MNNKFHQYDIIELIEDINPKLRKGMRGTILEKYNDDNFEIEILDSDGNNVTFGDLATFTVDNTQIKKV